MTCDLYFAHDLYGHNVHEKCKTTYMKNLLSLLVGIHCSVRNITPANGWSAIVLLCFLAFLPACSTQKGAMVQLEGARPVIDAANYPSIQAAIDALPDEGGIVQIPPGAFRIDRPLRVYAGDVYLKGSGSSTHIINEDKTGQPALILSADTTDLSGKDPLWRVQVSDIRISGNDNSGHGILARYINEIFITGVTVNYHGKDGIRLDHCIENPRVTQNQITYNKDVGLNILGGHDIVVNANQFEENGDALHCTDGFNLAMSGNNLDDHIRHGVVIENTYGSVLSGNMIEECNGTGIILDRDCYGINIGGNVIAHNGLGVDLKDAHGIAVSANTFTINQEHGLLIRSGSGRITVSGNSFSDSNIGDDHVKRRANDLLAAGITLDGCSEILISSNMFSGIHPGKALTLKSSPQDVKFDGNMIVDSESDHELLEKGSARSNRVIKGR